mgnify:CR=1 FL=1
MKKIISVALALLLFVSLTGCDGSGQEDEGKVLETANTHIDVSNNSGSIDVNEDTAKLLLGIYSPKQLGLVNPIEDYNLTLSAIEYDGKSGCKVEAFAEDADAAEGVFMILGTTCYKYDSKKKDFVPIVTNKTTEAETKNNGEQIIPDDPEITFQYHKENNKIMRDKFSKYDIKDMGLDKPVTELVFIVTGHTGYSTDFEKVYIVEVHEKNGELKETKLAFSEKGEFVYLPRTQLYEKLTVKEAE